MGVAVGSAATSPVRMPAGERMSLKGVGVWVGMSVGGRKDRWVRALRNRPVPQAVVQPHGCRGGVLDTRDRQDDPHSY